MISFAVAVFIIQYAHIFVLLENITNLKMDQFIIDNAEKFKSLVLSFKPKASVDRLKGGTLNINPDVLVATRLRPLIDEEVEGGVPQAVFCRSGSEGVLDAHELRKSVKWGPAINVSHCYSAWTFSLPWTSCSKLLVL